MRPGSFSAGFRDAVPSTREGRLEDYRSAYHCSVELRSLGAAAIGVRTVRGRGSAIGEGSARRESAPTSFASSRTSRSPARAWRTATRFPRPAFRPRRTIAVDTAAGFWRAWRQLRPRDKIVVHRVTFKARSSSCTRSCPTGPRCASRRARSSWGSRAPETYLPVWLNDDSHIRFYGGDVSDSASGGMAGTGIVVDDSSYRLLVGRQSSRRRRRRHVPDRDQEGQ